ncbi:hypothetical protein SG34_023465 [Thalassomonas viridans]|uniref:Uncharacterized protein n=1 Tax=Thalassomonas viridans TaxID=137584 RepID=A0AAE9Z0A8_9GAMM|nr:hypothetical protein [Thalassomonas viridans]WDE04270.1 hypothetical protein SG34_023465 [Thalassomonas viridans]
MSYNRARALSFLIVSLVLLLNATFLMPAAGQDLYSGTVSFIQFNDDESFIFQLSQKGASVVVNSPKCEIKNMFLVKKRHGKVKYEKLSRMRNDIRSVFLSNSPKLKISVSISFCDETTGYPLVDNIMLGQKKN